MLLLYNPSRCREQMEKHFYYCSKGHENEFEKWHTAKNCCSRCDKSRARNREFNCICDKNCPIRFQKYRDAANDRPSHSSDNLKNKIGEKGVSRDFFRKSNFNGNSKSLAK